MKTKTSELTGAALDWAVAKANNTPWMKPTHGNCCTCQTCGWPHDECKCDFSTDWSQGGPIIEREGLIVSPSIQGGWISMRQTVLTDAQVSMGDTPLIAAMRAFVASTLGDEVDVPKEIL